MPLDSALISELNVALNEADVRGLRISDDGTAAELLVEVRSLPETGPIDADARRILVLRQPSLMRILLRDNHLGPPITLSNLDALEKIFASLHWSDSLEGWEFIDSTQRVDDWPDQLSLEVPFLDGSDEHSIWWGFECNRPTSVTDANGSDAEWFFIEGTVYFSDLEVRRADGTVVPLSVFAANGRRWWDALHSNSDRLSIEAQRAAGDGPRWR